MDFYNFINSTISPEQLLSWMTNNIKFGWINQKGHIRTDFGSYFKKNYYVMLPEEVYNKRLGTCQEQAIFTGYIFKKSPYLSDIKVHLIFIQYDFIGSHTFIVYEQDEKYMFFENAFITLRGIDGPYNTIEEICIKVCKQLYKDLNKKDIQKVTNFKYTIHDPGIFIKPMSWKEYGNMIGYNESKARKNK